MTTLLVVPPAQQTGPQISPATFRGIVENASLASQVIDELKLRDRLHLQAPLTPQSFVERALSVEEVRATNIVKVKVTLPDAELAATASRRVAEKAIGLTQQITQQEGVSIQEQLKNHLEGAQQRLRSAEQELLAYKQAAQVDLIKEDTDADLRARSDLLDLTVDIQADAAVWRPRNARSSGSRRCCRRRGIPPPRRHSAASRPARPDRRTPSSSI